MLPREDLKVRIVLADDHMVVRAGLTSVLNMLPDFTLVGEAENGEEALVLCHKQRPDIVLMDVRMEGMGGIGATEAIKRYHPAVKIIGLSTFHDEVSIRKMLEAGACAFLPKTVSAEELIKTIIAVHRGELVAGFSAVGQPRHDADMQWSFLPPELAKHQRKILALLTKGFTNPEIATYLGVSMPTARYHVSTVLAKLGVSNRAEAAALAVREGLFSDEDF